MKNIVNIINFARGCEPRDNSIDLVVTLRKELELLNKYGLKSTVLFQYDALNQKVFRDTVAEYAANGTVEIGMWIELVRSCTLKAGAEWTGMDQEWDCGAAQCNLVGHTPENRKKILDQCMRAFYEFYGRYPSVVGAWAIDTVSLTYLKEKYGVKGACICRDQIGTDNYTLWGGYWSGAYYPSKNNMFSPAQTKENQLNIPVFRMLGSDPIYQYDHSLSVENGPAAVQGVVTLEPVCSGKQGGGSSPAWIDWFFMENFSGKALGYAYAQVGQENSFGWKKIGKGLSYQVEQLAKLQKEGKIECLTFGEAAEWFLHTYKETPATSVVVESDWQNEGRKTYWYESKNYRINLQSEKNATWIRDLFLFDENYPERYLNSVLDKEFYEFDNLPVVDGYRWTGNGVRCGVFFVGENGCYIYGDTEYQKGEAQVAISIKGQQAVNCIFTESELRFLSDKDFALLGQADLSRVDTSFKLCDKQIYMEYRGYKYSVEVAKGNVIIDGGKLLISSDNEEIVVKIR